MRTIYSFDVMKELAAGSDVYAIEFTKTKPIVENAAMLPGRMLARYIADEKMKWYASDIEEEDDEG